MKTPSQDIAGRIFDNWINGNITDAKKQAKPYQGTALVQAFTERGWSNNKAIKVAHYLKTGEGWQAACDAR